jgi:similar to spore coat protein
MMQQPTSGSQPLNDQLIAIDLLISIKNGIKSYAVAITESDTPEVRNTLKQHLNDAIQFHEKVSQYTINKGYYHPINVQEQLRVDMQVTQQITQANQHQ